MVKLVVDSNLGRRRYCDGEMRSGPDSDCTHRECRIRARKSTGGAFFFAELGECFALICEAH